jgi:hypothetical protein
MSSSSPRWLGPLICLEDFKGDVSKYLEHVFSIFTKDFVESKPIFRGNKVLYDNRDEDGKPAVFVHITTENDHTSGERVICLRRCERISWIRSIIENVDDPAVLFWEKDQKAGKRRAIRTYLFLEKHDFLVVLQKIKYGHYMITAIYVDNPGQKEKHLKAYEAYKNGPKT